MKKAWNFITKLVGSLVIINMFIILVLTITDSIMKYRETKKSQEDFDDDFDEFEEEDFFDDFEEEEVVE